MAEKIKYSNARQGRTWKIKGPMEQAEIVSTEIKCPFCQYMFSEELEIRALRGLVTMEGLGKFVGLAEANEEEG